MINEFELKTLIQRDWVKEIYTGNEIGCRCGCHGNYWKPGSKGFIRALNKAFKANPVIKLADNVYEAEKVAIEAQKSEKVCEGFGYSCINGHIDWIDIIVDTRKSTLKTITLYFK